MSYAMKVKVSFEIFYEGNSFFFEVTSKNIFSTFLKFTFFDKYFCFVYVYIAFFWLITNALYFLILLLKYDRNSQIHNYFSYCVLK